MECSRNRNLFSIIPIILLFISSNLAFSHAQSINGRQNLEIIIGGGADPPDTYSPIPPQPPFCPEPVPPPPPPPPPAPPECSPPLPPPPPPPSPPPPHSPPPPSPPPPHSPPPPPPPSPPPPHSPPPPSPPPPHSPPPPPPPSPPPPDTPIPPQPPFCPEPVPPPPPPPSPPPPHSPPPPPPPSPPPPDTPIPPQPPFCPEPVPPPPPPPSPPPPHSPPPPSPPPPHSPPPPSPPSPHSPPPPPPPSPPPPKPPVTPSGQPLELLRAIKVIQKFKQTIIHDPMKVTKTWKGRICEGSNYKGFICDTTISDGKKRVALVNFNGFDLGNSTNPLALKGFLDGLTDLIVFHANTNGFAGLVPSGIDTKRLPYLYELDLSNNKLTGGFPLTVLTATNLTFLDLRFNCLTGEVPREAFQLDLDVLFLNNNQFTGKIPDTLGQTPSLYVTLANNKFTGTIPKSIGQASRTLREILLLNNQLSGCLPYEIGLLKSATLFDASANSITGPIPLSFGCLQNLVYLNISHNQLYGRVPESLCRLKDLESVTLNHNFITEVGPDCRKLIAKKKLDVSNNCIKDLPDQKKPEECAYFFSTQKSCPDPESMSKVPCNIGYSAPVKKTRTPTRKLMGLPRTYAALQERA